MKHELRKLEIDNSKLRQTLKQKLNITTSMQPIKRNKNTQASDRQDEMYDEMIRTGFVEQMQKVSEETMIA